MNKINKKYIIILGSLLVLLLIIFGTITYYNEKKELAQHEDEYEYFVAPDRKDVPYSIWCFNDQKWEDCSFREFFLPSQLVSLSIDFTKLENMPETPYLCYYTDLDSKGMECLPRNISALGGLNLSENFTPKDNKTFTLIKVTIFPNNNFKDEEAVTLIDLEGKLAL